MIRRLATALAMSAAASTANVAIADDESTTTQEASPAETQAPVRDLAALLRSAEASWPGIRAARARIDAAQARLDEAWVSPFFQFNVVGTFSMAPGARGTPVFSPDPQLPLSNTWGPVLGVRVEGAIPLYTFGKLESARDAARAGVDVTERDEERARIQLRLDVRRAYFALGLALDAEQMFSEGRGKLDRAVRAIEERIEAGDANANEADRYRLSSTLSEVEARASEVERLASSSRAALRVLANEGDFTIPDCPLAPVEFELESLARYQSLARENRPELSQIRAGVLAREAALTAVRAQYFPDLALGLVAGLTYAPGITDQSNPFVQDGANSPTLAAALLARWSLDLWGTTARTSRARAERDETNDRLEEASRGIDIEIATIYEELRDARRRETAWGRGHRDTRAWFMSAAQAYQIGTNEPRDLVDAVRAYFTARFSHLQSIHDVNVATAKLERALGTDLVEPAQWEGRCESP
jgi:outer membrane protein TolC